MTERSSRRRRRPRLRAALTVLALSVLFSGCGATDLTEVHHFMAVDEDGNTTFYRVTITASTHRSEAKFRSGKFPAEAVDSVFGEVKPERDPESEVNALRDAVATAAKRYAALLTSEDSSAHDIRDALTKYEMARSDLETALKRQDTRRELETPEKFVFVFASDPSRVIQAIRNELDAQQLSGSLANVVQASVLRDALVLKEDFRLQSARLDERARVVGDALSGLDCLRADASSPAWISSVLDDCTEGADERRNLARKTMVQCLQKLSRDALQAADLVETAASAVGP